MRLENGCSLFVVERNAFGSVSTIIILNNLAFCSAVALRTSVGRWICDRCGSRSMATAEREPIMGVCGLCPQRERGPGAESLVRGSGGKAPWS